jgi:cyclic pyranopterin phosphate synthase
LQLLFRRRRESRLSPEAIARKPKGHDFVIDRRTKQPAVARHMSVTGG